MQRRPGWSGALTCTEIPANQLIWAHRGEDTFLISLRAAGGDGACTTYRAGTGS